MIVNPLSVCRVSAPDQTVGRVRYINEIYYYYYYYLSDRIPGLSWPRRFTVRFNCNGQKFGNEPKSIASHRLLTNDS